MKLKHILLAMGTVVLLGVALPARAQGFATLHNFTNTPDGANPRQLAWMNGLFYGATANGGANGYGSLFRLNTNGAAFAPVYSFTGAGNDGNTPNNPLVAGNLIYGTTKLGGTNGGGMIFAINTNGTGFLPLYSFAFVSPDGFYPQAGLLLSGATLYGTASNGGTNGGGTIFKINTNGTGYTILHWFTNAPDGFSPQSELVLSGGTLYGTTTAGGTSNYGTIFAITTNGTGYTLLHSFTNTPDGHSSGGLVLSAGVLYGVTSGGNASTNGTIFSINTNGSGYQILHTFMSAGLATNADGKTPKATLTLNGGYLYGTASSGGIGGGGTLFLISTNGTGFTVLRSFTNNAVGGSDLESGAVRMGNAVWGATYAGGTGYGTLYSLPMPVITLQPQGLTVTSGNPAAFSVSAADDSPIRYQWFFNTTTLLAGQTNATLNLTSATNNNAGNYTVVVSDNFGSVTSSPASLTVIGASTPPTITQQPQNFTVTNGYPASFTNVASGTAPLYYQWYFNTNTPLGGATNAILVIASATNNQAGYYTVIVTNTFGSATSSPARLTVIVPVAAPTITQQPHDLTVTNGYAASFTNMASGTGLLYYQWYFNGSTPVLGGTNAILVLPSVTTTQAGYYSVIVTNTAGSATSSPALLTVIVPVLAPTITQQPQDYTVTNGYDASFTNVASGTGPLYYQWYFNAATPVPDGTNRILILTFVATNQAGYYSVVVSNTTGSATSSPALLTVISTKPVIISQPQSVAVSPGDPVTFSVLAAGQNPLKYQWYTNSVIPAHNLRFQTSNSVSFASANASMQANYLVVITNLLGSVTSTPAVLTVANAPIITLNPQPTNVLSGAPASFTVGAVGASLLRFQWYFNTNTVLTNLLGNALAGATSSTLGFSAVSNSLAGWYSVIVTNTYGRATSSPAALTIQIASGQPGFLNYSFIPASGSFSLTLTNTASSANRLWASTNLTATNFWRVIASNVMAANGLWLFTDTNIVKTNQARFYRASSP